MRKKPVPKSVNAPDDGSDDLKSEGQRLLLCAPYSLGQIANTLGVSKQVVSYWRRGIQRPAYPTRLRLQASFGIPAPSWGDEPDGSTAFLAAPRLEHGRPAVGPDPLRPTVAGDLAGRDGSGAGLAGAPSGPVAPSGATQGVEAGSSPTSTMEGVENLLAVVREARARDGLLAAERVKLADAETRLLSLRHRMEKEAELSEDRIIRQHPKWILIRAAIAAALVPWPDAARATEAALRGLDLP